MAKLYGVFLPNEQDLVHFVNNPYMKEEDVVLLFSFRAALKNGAIMKANVFILLNERFFYLRGK